MRSVFAAALLSVWITADDRLKDLKIHFKSPYADKDENVRKAKALIAAFDTNGNRQVDSEAPNKKEGEELIKAMIPLWKAEGWLDDC